MAGPGFGFAEFIFEIIDDFLYIPTRFAEQGDEAGWGAGGREGWSGSDR
jgi:hypothetical protein